MSFHREPVGQGGASATYRDACPKFDISKGVSAFKKGRIICEFTDRFDEPIGIARFIVIGSYCELEYDFRSRGHGECETYQKFELRARPNGRIKDLFYVVCPTCNERKTTLFFSSNWACTSCLGLKSRSQLIHPLARKWEKLRRLEEETKYGRFHGAWNKAHVEKVLKLEELREKLENEPCHYASDKYSQIVSSNWRPLSAMDQISFPNKHPLAKVVDDLQAGTSPKSEKDPASLDPAAMERREFRGGYEESDPAAL